MSALTRIADLGADISSRQLCANNGHPWTTIEHFVTASGHGGGGISLKRNEHFRTTRYHPQRFREGHLKARRFAVGWACIATVALG